MSLRANLNNWLVISVFLLGLATDVSGQMVTNTAEGFETSDFSKFQWEHSGDSSWAISSAERNSGNYSAHAGSIDDDQSTTLQVTIDCVSGNITFYRKVSSESRFDYLKFYIDGVEKDKWSGEEDWTAMSFPVTAGTRTFEWTYSKDSSVSDHGDTAWIDDIVFPIDDNTKPAVVILFDPLYGGSRTLQAGDIIRVSVTKRSEPIRLLSCKIRITSASSGFDSGSQPLIRDTDGRRLYFIWFTEDLDPASDYEVLATVDDSTVTTTATLHHRSFGPHILATGIDAICPAPSLGLAFFRTAPHVPNHFPMLGPLGRGWTHNFNISIDELADGTVVFHTSSGLNRYFRSHADGSFESAPGDRGILSLANGKYRLEEISGLVYAFRGNRQVDYIEDRNGNRITTTYNSSDQLVKVQSSNGNSFKFSYNGQGRIATLVDHVGRITRFAYDTTGEHLTTVTHPSGLSTHYEYVSEGNYIQKDRLSAVIAPDGTERHYEFDTEGRVIRQTGKNDGNPRQFAYGEDGSTQVTDALGNTITVYYNRRGQPSEVVDERGYITTYVYDSAYRLIESTDPLGHAVHYVYDHLGNLTRIVDAAGGVISMEYESTLHKPTSFVDTLGREMGFQYDVNGNLLEVTFPDGTSNHYTYNPSGLKTHRVDRAGQTMTYNYNSMGLLTSEQFPDGKTCSFEYDSVGLLTAADNHQDCRIEYSYNTSDNVVQCVYFVQGSARTFDYQYTPAGFLKNVRYPDETSLAYSYDDAGRMTEIVDVAREVPLVQYFYDDAGRRVRKEMGNGTFSTYQYDAAGHVTNLIHYSATGNVISRFTYTYDAAGNVVSKDTIEGTESYQYDALNQLTSVVTADGLTTDFVYDAMGNRTTVLNGGIAVAYNANELNQYTSVGPDIVAYDLNGNLVSRTQGGQTTTYEYDSENRLIRVSTPTNTVSYSYDPFGLRLCTSNEAGSVYYFRDRSQVALETDADGTVQASYIWGVDIDEIERMNRGGNDYYYTQDVQRSVSDLTDSTGMGLEHYRYDAFGLPLNSSAVGNPWYYTSLAFEFSTGLQYSRLRYYSPSLGRFLSPDPIGISGGPNLYAYVFNSPLRYRDPWGLTSGGGSGACEVIGYLEEATRQAESRAVSAAIDAAIASPTGQGTATVTVVPQGFASDYGVTKTSSARTSSSNASSNNGYYSSNYGVSTTSYGYSSYGYGSWGMIGSYYGFRYYGGICPTFVQLPQDMKNISTKTAAVDASKEQLGAKITVPIDQALLRSDIPIFGVAGGKNFKKYRVEYGRGENPTEWHLIESSTIPQPKCDVGFAEMHLMQGDIDIRGNLATWNTGLKNWEHLPWHPAEDPTDFNGIYTIRLVVEGKDGKKIEDRVTCEVGRVIAQCLPGVAISPDKQVVMRFPEQSLTHPFRVYTILPLSDVREEQPLPPKKCRFIGSTYRIREPGDKFIKGVTLEFNPKATEMTDVNPNHIGICQYDADKKRWIWLKTGRSTSAIIFSTILTELPAPKAIYALAFDPAAERSTIAVPDVPLQKPAEPVSSGVLVHCCFEKDLGTFRPRDRFVGAGLLRDNKVTPDGSYCLKLINENFGGNFSCTVMERPFDLREYPLMAFDYRIGPNVKIDFLLKVNGRWYNLQLTDEPIDYYQRDVNIGNLGAIEGIMRDNKWHSAVVDLRQILRRKTRRTKVEEIVLADWDIGGYMKLEFGKNPRGAALWLDNLRIYNPEPETARTTPPPILWVDRFEDPDKNVLGNNSGIFSSSDPEYCVARLIQENNPHGKVLQLNYDVSTRDSYGGYWSLLDDLNIQPYDKLCMNLKKSVGSGWCSSLIALEDVHGKEMKLSLERYLGPIDEEGWHSIEVPLIAFAGVLDTEHIKCFSLTFQHSKGYNRGRILLDNLRFKTTKKDIILVDDFESGNFRHNFLGQGAYDFSNGAAAFKARLDQERHPGDHGTTLLLSYGGSIGLDMKEAGFSFCGIHTGLGGLDASSYEVLSFRIRGNKGGETPNVYLTRNTCSRTSPHASFEHDDKVG